MELFKVEKVSKPVLHEVQEVLHNKNKDDCKIVAADAGDEVKKPDIDKEDDPMSDTESEVSYDDNEDSQDSSFEPSPQRRAALRLN